MADHPGIEFYWVVFGSDEERAREASESANMFLLPVKKKTIVVKNFRDGFFPYIGPGIKKFFEQLKQQFFPDLIFTHYRDDLHQDHRLISDLTWNTFREHLILEYEIPKYDGDFGSPNFFVHLDKSLCQKKTEYILTCFKSQRGRHWFTHDTFLSVLRLRGMESCSPTNYAEGFYCRKAVL
jgi:LmbE family N-acetylglucosaminyl deacetylase